MKSEAYNTLNTTMGQLMADCEKDVEAAKEAAKADLMKDYWGKLLNPPGLVSIMGLKFTLQIDPMM